MRLRPNVGWFLAFTAVFAVLAGFVFWGTWSTSVAPVMPDCTTSHSPYWIPEWFGNWLTNGKCVPDDLKVFLGGPDFWQELQYAFALYCAALGMAYFCRGRGLSLPSCYGAGLLLAFCGYWASLFSAGHLGWFRWMTYGVFGFGLCDRAVRKGKLKNWLLLGACVAWGSFYQPDLWLLFSVFTAVYFVHCCVREWKLPWKGALIALATFAVVGMPSFRTAFMNDLAGRDKQIEDLKGTSMTGGEKGREDGEERWIFATNWSLPTAETLEFLVPRLNGDTSCPMTLALGARYGTGVKPYVGALGRPKDAPSGNYRQHSLYVGWVTCLLALCGIVLGGRKCRFFAVAAVVFWVFSLGRNCEPVYRLVYALPFGDYLRAPVKWHHLTEFCLVVLAGFGIEGLMTRAARFGRFLPWAVVAFVLFGACDLARVDRLYCAPVDMREAHRQNCGFQMTFLRRADFNNPQIAAMVQAKRIVPLANPNPEMFVVGVLQPWKRSTDPLPPFGLPAALGVLSLLASLGVALFAIRRL